MKNVDLLLLSLIIALSLTILFNSYVIPHQRRITSSAIAQVRVIVYGGCYWTIYPGWNHLSFCSNMSHTAEDVIQHIGDVKYLLKWNSNTQKFDVYSPRALNKPFDIINYNESFFVLYLPNNTSKRLLDNPGEEFNDTLSLHVVRGWNSMPYPYVFPTTLNKINSELGSYRFLLKWDPSNQRFIIYSPRMENQTISGFRVGEAYFVFMNSSKEITYNPGEMLS